MIIEIATASVNMPFWVICVVLIWAAILGYMMHYAMAADQFTTNQRLIDYGLKMYFNCIKAGKIIKPKRRRRS